MLRPKILLLGFGGLLVLGSFFSFNNRRPSLSPSAEEIHQAIWDSERRHYDAVLNRDINAAHNNLRKLSLLWHTATKYQLPHHAKTADIYMTQLVLPKAELAYRKKHITKLMARVPEQTDTWRTLEAQRDRIEKP